jgi:hypothetical protein
MPKTTKATPEVIELIVPTDPIEIDSMEAAQAALEEMQEINTAITAAQARTVDLKKSVTAWAVQKKIDVIQIDGCYFRQITRMNRGWDAEKLKKIVKGMKDGSGKPLWNFITKRVPDAEKIDAAVTMKFISQKKVDKAFVEIPQAPFLQRFEGEAVDG